MNNSIKEGDTIEDTILVGTRGRNSKKSSKVFLIKFRKRVATELDEWFGPVDELARRREMEELNEKRKS